MSNLLQFVGGSRPPAALVNAFSSGSPAGIEMARLGREYLSGALTANVLANPTGLSTVTGSGVLKYVALYTKNTTSRTLRLRLTIDGVVVFDSTSAAIAATNTGIVAVGALAVLSLGGSNIACLEAIPFNSSFQIQVASSLTETDNIAVALAYHTHP